jgi:anti-sigma B factor antagonist
MNGPKISFNVRHITPSTCVIDIHGELTIQAETALMATFDEAGATSAAAQGAVAGAASAPPARLRNIVLNFAPMTYMNSSGIGLLVMFLVRLNREGQKLMATGLSTHYQRIFELTRLNEAIRVFSTEAEALTSIPAA